MAQKKKDYARLNCKLDKTVSDKLEKLCEETGLSKTSATERALLVYIERFDKTGKS